MTFNQTCRDREAKRKFLRGTEKAKDRTTLWERLKKENIIRNLESPCIRLSSNWEKLRAKDWERRTYPPLEITRFQTIESEKRNAKNLYSNLRGPVFDFECREIDWLFIRELGLRLSSGRVYIYISFSKTIFKTKYYHCWKAVFRSLFVSVRLFFTLLIVRSHPFTHRLVSPISDWSTVCIKYTMWADKLIDPAIRWHNQPSGMVSRLKAESSQCLGKVDVLSQLRWEVSDRTATVLWGVASRICPKYHVVFMCSDHLAFSPSNLFESRWCNHTVVPTLSLFYQISIWPTYAEGRRVLLLSVAYIDIAFSWWDNAAAVFY